MYGKKMECQICVIELWMPERQKPLLCCATIKIHALTGAFVQLRVYTNIAIPLTAIIEDRSSLPLIP